MPIFAEQFHALSATIPVGIRGTVTGISGMTIEASDLPLPLGSLCEIQSTGGRTCSAEVIGFTSDRTLLMPLSGMGGVSRGDCVRLKTSTPRMFCSDQLLGRVVDGFGRPFDGKGEITGGVARRIDQKAVAPMDRAVIRQPLYTGVRCIDAIHTCGTGQRMGIFSGPGVGKSTLMSAIAKNTSADISVVALIGERGREVQEFIEHALGEEGLKRCVMIVSTSDDTPLLKVRAAKVACTVAEYFRDQGKNVLLMMDSLTRLAQAQRQIGLAAREPPATKGFPPSVFALIPEILERAGKTPTGSITGFYTVLVEGDDFNEPIPDAVKGITDGHLWLNRVLANSGHFPAVDMIQSISRVRSDVAPKEVVDRARRVQSLLAIYDEIADLVSIGAYVPGSNAQQDLALAARPRIVEFLKQDTKTAVTGPEAYRQLGELNQYIDTLAAQLQTKQPGKPGQATGLAQSSQPRR
jgi:flagellum-specific ATP synthase